MFLEQGTEETKEDDAWAIRERLRRDPEYRLLFSAADKAKPEHLKAAAAMLKILRNEPVSQEELTTRAQVVRRRSL